MRSSLCIVLVLSILSLFQPQLAWADGSDNPGGAVNTGVDLDLSSADRSLSAASVLAGATEATINVAGASRTVSGADMLTAAEFVAVRQVLNAGQQYLQLNELGVAVGGGLRLSSNLLSGINNLVIPEGVKAFQNAAISQNLSLIGNFTNSGSFYAFSSNPAVNAASFSASSIYNNAGALISANLANFTLNAVNNIVNAGTIMSSGNLALNAGGSIINSLPMGVSGISPVMQAVNNLNLNSSTIVNSGLMSALNGNLSFSSLSHMNINGSGGSIQALLGSINVRDVLYSGSGNLNIVGGDWLAKQINLYSGSGSINAQLGDVSGVVSTSAAIVHLGAATDKLVLGSVCVTGDPVYYNLGDIEITSDVIVGEALAIIATGNITSTAGVNEITARDGLGEGFDINIIAGANILTACSPCSPDLAPGSEATAQVTIDGASLTGGNIDFSQSSALQINANSTANDNNGGDITLAAYAAGAGTGIIRLAAGSLINSSGDGVGDNGNVTVVAGGASGETITLGAINAAGGAGTALGGTVYIGSTQPVSDSGVQVTFNTNGMIANFDYITVGTVLAGGTIGVNGNISAANNLNVFTSGFTNNGGALSAQNFAVTGLDNTLIVTNNGGSITTTTGDVIFTNTNGALFLNNFMNSVFNAGTISAAGNFTVNTTNGQLYVTQIGSTMSGNNFVTIETITPNGALLSVFNYTHSSGVASSITSPGTISIVQQAGGGQALVDNQGGVISAGVHLVVQNQGFNGLSLLVNNKTDSFGNVAELLAGINLTIEGTGYAVEVNNVGGTIRSGIGTLTIENISPLTGVGLYINNSSDTFGNIGIIQAPSGTLTLRTSLGNLNILNTGGWIYTTIGDLNITNSFGDDIYITNLSDCNGNISFIDVDVTGNLNIISPGDIVATGNSVLGTFDVAGTANFTSTAGSVIVGQGVIEPGGGVNVFFQGNMLLYSSNGVAINPNVTSGQGAPSLLVDPDGIDVYYFGNEQTVIPGTSIIVLSTSVGGFNANMVANTLEVTNIVGDLVISIRNEPTLNDIASLVTGGGNLYLESTNAGGLVMANLGDIDTRQAVAGSGGYAILNSTTAITTQSINTVGVGDGNGGNVTLLAQGGSIDTTNGGIDAAGVFGGRGGDVLLTTLPGGGNVSFNSINTTGGDSSQFGGGNLTITTCGTCTGTGFIDTSAVPVGFVSSALIDAGHVNISAAGDINLVSIRAEGNKLIFGHYADLITSSGIISVTSFIDISGGSSDGLSDGTGSGGNLRVIAPGTISLGGTVNTKGDTDGHAGSMTIRSSTGAAIAINGGIDVSGAGSGNGSSVSLDSFNSGNDVTFVSINTTGGATSSFGGGSVDISGNNVTGGSIDTSAVGAGVPTANQDAGHINISAAGDIDVGNLNAIGNAVVSGHYISVVSQNGNVTTDFIDASASGDGHGGDILVRALTGAATTGTITTNGQTSGNAGGVTVEALTMDVLAISASAGGSVGNAGAVTLTAPDGIVAVSINAVGGTTSGLGGTVNVTANNGLVSFTDFIDSSARGAGRGGDVTITANADITLRSINAVGGQATAAIVGGGNILIQSTIGGLTATGAAPRFFDSSGSLFNSGAAVANAGTIIIVAPTGIVGVGGAFSVRAEGSFSGGNGADVTITSNGIITLDFVSSSASTTGAGATGVGNAGNIVVTGPGGISVLDFRAQGGITSGDGGNIDATAAAGSINVDLFAASNAASSGVGTTGSGGNVTFIASTGITFGTVLSPGFILANANTETGDSGNVELTTTTGDIFAGVIGAAMLGANGSGGTIDLDTGVGNITTGLLANFGGTATGNAGALLNVHTGNGNITIGAISASAAAGTASSVVVASDAGGNVSTTAGGITATGGGANNGGPISVTASAGSITLAGGLNSGGGSSGSAGGLTLLADDGISLSFASATGGTVTGDGGAIDITSNTGDILLTSFASSRAIGGGTGGNVDLTATVGTVRVLGVTGLGNAIQSNGAGVGSAGDVTITYSDAGSFTIDPAGGMTNGTAGPIAAIATGTGAGGTVTITNNAGDIDLVLNSTIDVTSTGGAAGLMNFAAGLSSTTITGNANGLLSGPLLASGDDVTITLARPNTTLLVGAINAADLISITVTTGASSINVPVGANIHGDGAGIILNTPTVTNDGSLRALTGLASLTNAGSLALSGTGTLFGITIGMNSTGGSVTATQNTITGTVSGTASTNFNVTANISGLTANNITATTGAIGLVAGGGLMSVIGNSVITAGTNVSITGNALAGVSIGGGVGTTAVVTAGLVGGALNAFSLNMNDYTYAQIASPGGITVTSVVGSITLNEGVTLDGIGGSVGLMSADNITFGAGNDLFSQGAYVWMQASNNITAPAGTSITSVGRYTAGTVVVDGVTINDFAGGGIAVFAGSGQPNYNTYLKNTAVTDRTATGSVDEIGLPDTTGTPLVLNGNLINGAYLLLEVPAGGVLSITNSAIAIDGGVITIDPPGIITFNGVILTAVGPALIPVVTPSVGSAPAAAAPGPIFDDVALPASSPILPPEGTAIQTDVSDFATPAERNATAVMQRQPQMEQITQQSAAWVFVSGNCQPFSMQLDESLLFGCGGTMFRPEQQPNGNGIDMKEGRIVAITANKRFAVTTKYGEASIPPEGAGIIEQKANGVFRLVNLAGGDAEMTFQNGAEVARVPVKAGEELVVADNSVSEEDLIPIDGIDRVAVAGAIKIAGLQASKSTFDKKQMFERESLIHCSMGSDMYNVRRRIDRVRNEMMGAEPAKVTSSSGKANTSMKDAPYVPISYRTGLASNPSDGVISLRTDSASLRYMGQTKIGIEKDGVVDLAQGSVLVSAGKSTVLKCGEHLVSVDPGTVAMVSNNNGLVKVSNLWESAGGAVRTYSAGRMVSLNVGKQIIVGSDSYSVTSAMKSDPVARRRSFFFDLPDGKGAARSEVSIVSLCQNEPVLQRLLKSVHDEDHMLVEKIVKMAACLAQTTANHGPYQTTAGSK